MAVVGQSTKVTLGGTRGGPDVATLRQDRWWVQPVVIVSVLTAFVIYSTWAAFQNKNYYVGALAHRDLISPLYSPCIAAQLRAGLDAPAFACTGWNFSPALLDPHRPAGLPAHLLLLPPQLLPRLLVVTARRARWPTPTRSYSGETRFPLVMQNLAPLLLLPGARLQRRAHLRRGAGLPPAGHRASASRSARSCCVVNAVLLWLLHAQLSRLPAPVRRPRAQLQRAPGPLPALEARSRRSTPSTCRLRLGVAWSSSALTDVYVRLVASGALTDYKLF